MALIEYDVKKLEGVIRAYESFQTSFNTINNGINDSIDKILNNWSGDTENYLLAKNDLDSIRSNLIKIETNSQSIASLFEEVTNKFKGITY